TSSEFPRSQATADTPPAARSFRIAERCPARFYPPCPLRECPRPQPPISSALQRTRSSSKASHQYCCGRSRSPPLYSAPSLHRRQALHAAPSLRLHLAHLRSPQPSPVAVSLLPYPHAALRPSNRFLPPHAALPFGPSCPAHSRGDAPQESTSLRRALQNSLLA